MSEPKRSDQRVRKSGKSGKSGQKRKVPYDPQMIQWGQLAASTSYLDPHDRPDDEDTQVSDYLLVATIRRILEGLPILQREAIEHCIFEQRSKAAASYAMRYHDKGVKEQLRLGLIAVEEALNDPIIRALVGTHLPEPDPMRTAMSALLDEMNGDDDGES